MSREDITLNITYLNGYQSTSVDVINTILRRSFPENQGFNDKQILKVAG